MAKKMKKGVVCGRVVRFRAIDKFLRNNGGVRAIAYQQGGKFAVLANNGNCTPLFNTDINSLQILLGSAKFDSILTR